MKIIGFAFFAMFNIAHAVDLDLFVENKQFLFYSVKADEQVAILLYEHAVKHIEQLSKDFDHEYDGQITIYVYPDVQSFHESINWIDAPDWVVGHINPGQKFISLVSPNNPGPEHTYESMFGILRNNLSRVFVKNKYKHYIPRWLLDGVGFHKSDWKMNVKNRLLKLQKAGIELPTLGQLDEWDTAKFDKIAGHSLSYSILEFMLEKWNWQTIYQLLEDPTSFELIFNMSQSQFRNEWIAFLDKKYLS